MKGKIEKWHPLVLATFLSVVLGFSFYGKALPSNLKEILASATTLAGIAVGFLATAMSILFTINNSFIVKQIIKTNTFDKLVNYFIDAINWLCLLCGFSFLGLFLELNQFSDKLQALLISIWLFTLIISGLSTYRVIKIFAAILRAAKRTN